MDCYADDAVLRLHGFNVAGIAPGALGKHAVGEWFGDWFRQFGSDYRFDIEQVSDLGAGQVLMIATHVATSRTAGVPLQGRGGWLFVVRDGQIVRCDAYATVESALGAAELHR
jgi:ketosteroid isomerase-like protein